MTGRDKLRWLHAVSKIFLNRTKLWFDLTRWTQRIRNGRNGNLNLEKSPLRIPCVAFAESLLSKRH